MTTIIRRPCSECGRGWSWVNGLCVSCNTRALMGKPMESRDGKATASAIRRGRQARRRRSAALRAAH